MNRSFSYLFKLSDYIILIIWNLVNPIKAVAHSMAQNYKIVDSVEVCSMIVSRRSKNGHFLIYC